MTKLRVMTNPSMNFKQERDHGRVEQKLSPGVGRSEWDDGAGLRGVQSPFRSLWSRPDEFPTEYLNGQGEKSIPHNHRSPRARSGATWEGRVIIRNCEYILVQTSLLRSWKYVNVWGVWGISRLSLMQIQKVGGAKCAQTSALLI